MRPQLVDNLVLEKLINKNFRKTGRVTNIKSTSETINISQFIINNWYYILITFFVVYLIYMYFKNRKSLNNFFPIKNKENRSTYAEYDTKEQTYTSKHLGYPSSGGVPDYSNMDRYNDVYTDHLS